MKKQTRKKRLGNASTEEKLIDRFTWTNFILLVVVIAALAVVWTFAQRNLASLKLKENLPQPPNGGTGTGASIEPSTHQAGIAPTGVNVPATNTGQEAGFPIYKGVGISPQAPNEHVRKLQQFLISKGHSVGATGADGRWGELTEQAVQKANLPSYFGSTAMLNQSLAQSFAGVGTGIETQEQVLL